MHEQYDTSTERRRGLIHPGRRLAHDLLPKHKMHSESLKARNQKEQTEKCFTHHRNKDAASQTKAASLMIHDRRRGVMHFAPPREATLMHRRRNCIAKDRDAEFLEEAQPVDDLMLVPPNGASLGTWMVRPVTATF